MLNHSVNFEFIGIDPECEVRSFITSVADRLHSLAPSNSFMKVTIKKERGAIEASCKIASQAGEFVAEAVCNSPITAIHQIESSIMQQFNEWMKHRFLDGRSKIRPSRPHLEISV